MNAPTNSTAASEFLETVRSLLSAYHHWVFKYVAVVHEGELVILRARLCLMVDAPGTLEPEINTASVRAGEHLVERGSRDIDSWVRLGVVGDRLPIAGPHLLRVMLDTSRYSIRYRLPSFHYFESCHHKLTIEGVHCSQLIGMRQREIDRELLEESFDSVHEIMKAYQLDHADQTTLEILADPVASFAQPSKLTERRVAVSVRLARELEPKKLRLTFRDADKNNVSFRHIVSGLRIKWRDGNAHMMGSYSFELQANAILDCRAMYDGHAQGSLRLIDEDELPNVRRQLIEQIDPGLQRVEKLLLEPTDKLRDDFESAVALLFYMLGFAPAHVGGLSGMQNEIDIVVSDGDDNVYVVECTTGVPNDSKLTRLVSRSERVRDVLEGTKDHNVRYVTPILVAPRPPAELEAVRSRAQHHGVILICRPDLEQALQSTLFAADSRAVQRTWQYRQLAEGFLE